MQYYVLPPKGTSPCVIPFIAPGSLLATEIEIKMIT